MSDRDGYVTTLHPEGAPSDRVIGKLRKLYRPTIDYWDAALRTAATVFCGLIVAGIVWLLSGERNVAAYTAIALWGLVLIWNRRRILIWFVLVYQARASDSLRRRCLFTPSCSEYMILAIQEYGAIRGVWKGICRLRRCHSPNGGIDYP